MNMNAETSMAPPAFPASTNGSTPASQRTADTPPDPAEDEDDGDPKRAETMKLIKYVLSKFASAWLMMLCLATTSTITQETAHIACPHHLDPLRFKGRVPR
jgi:hypothetical protein